MPEASEQPSCELAVDGGKIDSETAGEPNTSEQREDTLEKIGSEVAEGVPIEDKAVAADRSEEKEGGDKDSGDVKEQQPAAIELSSEIESDAITDTQVIVEDSESKTDHSKDKGNWL